MPYIWWWFCMYSR